MFWARRPGITVGSQQLKQSLLDDGEESIVNVHICYGRGLEIGDVSVAIAPILGLFLRDLPVRLITFVAHDDEGEIICILTSCMIDEAFLPFLKVFKGLFLC